MPTKRNKGKPICGRLGQQGRYGTVDVCKLAQGHSGPHSGAYHKMTWEDVEGKRADSKIVVPPSSYIPDRGGNIRGN